MAKRVIQMYDKYKSTTKVYPKIIEESFEPSAKEYIEGQVVADPELAGTEEELGSIEIGGTKYKIGGGVPTITFEESQMIDASHIQLTNEQYEIVSNNGFVTILFQGAIFGCNVLFLGESVILSSYLLGDDINMAFLVIVDPDTKIATYSNNTLPRAKQLYQHNISIYSSGSYDYTIMVISDSSTQVISNNDLINLLKNNMNKTIIAIGTYQDNGTKNITKAKFIEENGTYKMEVFSGLSSSVKWMSYNVAEDSVITL